MGKIVRSGTKANKVLTRLRLYGSSIEAGFRLQTVQGLNRPITSLEGYWQSDHYFKNIRKKLLEELVPLQIPSFPVCLNQSDTVAVHVRRTDYLAEERYGFLGIDYYREAILKMQSLITKPSFIFFSDDLEWCKNEFKEAGKRFFEEAGWEKDYLQLYAMSRCNHQIIANSSFSWWGAWLNNAENKIVIRPANPFKDKSLEYEAYYPKEWLSIQND